jgi:hypothetical protein
MFCHPGRKNGEDIKNKTNKASSVDIGAQKKKSACALKLSREMIQPKLITSLSQKPNLR